MELVVHCLCILIFASISAASEGESHDLRSTGQHGSNSMTPDLFPTNRNRYILNTVNGSEIAVSVYRRLREDNPRPTSLSMLSSNDKNRICHHIGKSSFFSLQLEEKPIYMYNLREKLQKAKPEILLSLYTPSPNHAPGQALVYTNPTISINVRLTSDAQDSGTSMEYAFRFLTSALKVDEDEALISSYFISEEYNVSDTPTLNYIAGRFIFEDDKKEDSMEMRDDSETTDKVLFALAEEPATTASSTGFEVEMHYLRRRGFNAGSTQILFDAGDKEESRICVLNLYQRIRVCSQVFNSTHFAHELKFIPEKEYVDEEECFEKEILFEDERTRVMTGGRMFKEWTIRCRPEEYYADYQYEYFLSRVHESVREVYVYRRGPNSRIILENMFDDVRFINY